MAIKELESGFTLVEVMIALAIFGSFAVSFETGKGFSITDSMQMKKELKLREFAQQKINEIIINPPELSEKLTQKADIGNFERDSSIKYELTYKKFEVPDYDKLKGKDPDLEEEQDEKSGVQKQIFENVKKNIEEMIWQVQVKVLDTNSDNTYILSTWLMNDKHAVKLESI